MQSSMYRVFDQNMKPAYHWYKPAAPEWGSLSPGEYEHVRKGGLLLRKADGGRTNFDTFKRGRATIAAAFDVHEEREQGRAG